VFTRVTSYLKWIESHTGKIRRVPASTANPIDGQHDNGNSNSATYIVIGKIFLLLAVVTRFVL